MSERKQTSMNDAEAALDLLRLAGPRSDFPPEKTLNVYAGVRAHWQKRTDARRRLKRISVVASLAVAASVVLVVALWNSRAPGNGAELAFAEVLRGNVFTETGGDRLPLALGAALRAGATVTTGADSRVALRLAGGESLRLDRGSRLVLEEDRSFRLHQGAVYIDSDSGARERHITLATTFAVVRDVGTRFEVRLQNDDLLVRVRDGLVEVETDQIYDRVVAGQEAMLNDGRLSLRHLAPSDPVWSWLLEVAPAFPLDGSSATEFLRWVTRETGLELRWTSPALALRAETIVLHGDISSVRPDEAPELVLPTCGLAHRVERSALVVGPKSR